MDDDEDVHFFTMAGWWHGHETFIMTGWQRYEKSNMKDLKKQKYIKWDKIYVLKW